MRITRKQIVQQLKKTVRGRQLLNQTNRKNRPISALSTGSDCNCFLGRCCNCCGGTSGCAQCNCVSEMPDTLTARFDSNGCPGHQDIQIVKQTDTDSKCGPNTVHWEGSGDIAALWTVNGWGDCELHEATIELCCQCGQTTESWEIWIYGENFEDSQTHSDSVDCDPFSASFSKSSGSSFDDGPYDVDVFP